MDREAQWLVSHQEGCVFDSGPGTFLCGVSMFSLGLLGFSPGWKRHSPSDAHLLFATTALNRTEQPYSKTHLVTDWSPSAGLFLSKELRISRHPVGKNAPLSARALAPTPGNPLVCPRSFYAPPLCHGRHGS